MMSIDWTIAPTSANGRVAESPADLCAGLWAVALPAGRGDLRDFVALRGTWQT